MKNKRKFTLLELLIVIAIIAILAALLLPSLSSAKNKAKQIKCAGNLKQLATATGMYINDYNGWFPQNPGGTQAESTGKMWDAQLGEYFNYSQAKGPPLFHCPLAKCYPTLAYPQENRSRGYVMNYYVYNNYSESGIKAMGKGDIPQPSKLALFCELTTGESEVPTYGGTSNWYTFTTPSYWGEAMAWRHSKAMNVMYGDLSVRLTKWSKPYPYGYPYDAVIYWQNGLAKTY